jgi:hypothetical protein
MINGLGVRIKVVYRLSACLCRVTGCLIEQEEQYYCWHTLYAAMGYVLRAGPHSRL